MKLPAIDLQGTLGKVPGLSKFIKPKAGASSASGAVRGKAAQAKSHEQQVQQRLDLTMKGLGGLATVLVLFALYTVFSQSGLNKAIHTAAPPMVDLSELVATHGGKGASGKSDHAKEAKAANNAKLKLPEGTDPRIDYAFEQIANFENTRSEAVLRSTRANVAGVAPGSVAARAGFRVGDFILSIDGDQAGFVWDSLRKLTAAGKSSVLLEVQRGNEVLRGELMAPEGELLTSTNTGLLFEIPEGYRFIGENDRRELRGGFSRAYMEGLAGDERLAYATSLALLGGNLVKRGVEQADLKPSDPMWLKTEQILADHHSKFSKALAHHGAVLETMQANLQAGFVKIGALLLAALIAGIAALASALQLNKHLSEQGIGAMRAQFQGLRSQMDQLAHAQAASAFAQTTRSESMPQSRVGMRQASSSAARAATDAAVAPAASAFSLAELAARVALDSDNDVEQSADTGSKSTSTNKEGGQLAQQQTTDHAEGESSAPELGAGSVEAAAASERDGRDDLGGSPLSDLSEAPSTPVVQRAESVASDDAISTVNDPTLESSESAAPHQEKGGQLSMEDSAEAPTKNGPSGDQQSDSAVDAAVVGEQQTQLPNAATQNTEKGG